MSTLKAVNVTKYAAGGTGDNIIADGYVKTVEKVWIDYYTNTATVSTTDTIQIASIPPNKKIMDIIVLAPKAAFSATTTTILCGFGGVTGGTQFIEATWTGCTPTLTNVMSYMNNNIGYLTTGTTNTIVSLSLGVAATTTTGSTIYTVVKYT